MNQPTSQLSKTMSNEQTNKLPDDFFDSNKKSKKEQEDQLDKEMQEFEKEMEALQTESDEYMSEQFEKLQEERNIDELNQQIEQWKRIVDLEKKAEELKNKPFEERVAKRFKPNSPKRSDSERKLVSSDINLATNDEFDDENSDDDDDGDLDEANLIDWRSKGL